jgi:hypothetical protein
LVPVLPACTFGMGPRRTHWPECLRRAFTGLLPIANPAGVNLAALEQETV